jgi:hypothetical protein
MEDGIGLFMKNRKLRSKKNIFFQALKSRTKSLRKIKNQFHEYP